jgi:hypothetical protein
VNTNPYLFMSELEVGRDKMTDRVSETCSTFSRLEATLPVTDNRQFSFMSKCIYIFGHKWSNPLQKRTQTQPIREHTTGQLPIHIPNHRRLVASSNFSTISSKKELAQRAWYGLQFLSNNSSNLLSSLGDYYQHLSMLPF